MSDFVILITLNYNQNKYTSDCINSILQCDYENFKIILIDNGSSNENFQELTDILPVSEKIILKRIDKNIGYVGGVNFGFKCTEEFTPDYILIMNNDTLVDRNMISSLVNCSKKYSDKCIVSGKILDYNNNTLLQTTGSILSHNRFMLFKHVGQSETDNGQYDTEKERDMLDDVFWLFNYKLYKEIGRYNTLFYFNGESADFALRAKKAGYKLIYCPEAKLWHKGSLSVGGREKNPFLSYWNTRSKLLLRYLYLRRTDFILFYLFTVKNIMFGYIKCLIAICSFKQPYFSITNASFKALYDFTMSSKRETK